MTLNDPIWLQNAVYSASEFRDVLEVFPGIGAVGTNDLKVSQRGAGANMSVDVAAGLGIIPNAVSTRGKYLVRSTATANVVISASPGSGNSRIDLIIATVKDTEYGDPTDRWELSAVAGTPAGVPTIPAQPAGSILLATIAVGTGVASITNANVTDQRRYARTVTYADRLPSYATDGQIIVASSGAIFTRSGGTWKSAPDASQYGTATATMGATTLPGSATAYCTATGPTPTGPVNVLAQFNGYAIASTGSNAVSQVKVQISLDGGSTWNTGDDVTVIASTSLTPTSLAVGHVRQGTPSGSIKARILANRTGSPQPDLSGHIVLMVTPG